MLPYASWVRWANASLSPADTAQPRARTNEASGEALERLLDTLTVQETPQVQG